MAVKKVLKNILHKFGIEIIPYSKNAFEQAKLIDQKAVDEGSRNFLKLLTVHEVDLIFDIGANAGNWAKRIFDIGYSGRIVSFEPLSSVHNQLLKMQHSNPSWEVAERCAIGDIDGEIDINIAENSESSSILAMLETHLDAAPHSGYVGSEKVKIFKLDTIAPQYLKHAHVPFLKIDTQGYEEKVLNGALEILPKIKGVQLESSLVPLYEKETLFENMLKKLNSLGFELYRISPGFSDYRTGRTLQANCTFFRQENL